MPFPPAATPDARADAPPPLGEALAAFIESGLSITVAGCGERLVPSIAKAVAARVDPDRRALTILLFADQSAAVCRDIAANGRIAVCLSRPSTHETVQVKGRDARAVPATPQDVAAARRSLDLFTADLGSLGWNAEFVDAFFWRDPADLVALRFTPCGAFTQTPGANAGAPIPAR